MKLLSIITIIFLVFSQSVWAGDPPPILTVSPADLGLTFNPAACNAGQQVITGSSAIIVTEASTFSSYSYDYDILALETGQATQTISNQAWSDSSVNNPHDVAVDSQVYNNVGSHTTGDTLTVNLVCNETGSTPGNCYGNLNGSALSAGSTFPLNTMTYACPPAPPPFSASVKNNWVLAILALFMALLGAGILFKKNRQV